MNAVWRAAPSLRRGYLDECYEFVLDGCGTRLLLDVGGQRANRRGAFDPSRHADRVVTVNIHPETRPDIVADAAALPIRTRSIEVVLCSEVLEHVRFLEVVVCEISRVLMELGGLAVMSSPFLVALHRDPSDFRRLLADQWVTLCREYDLVLEALLPQGSVASVLVDGLAHLGWTAMPRRPWVGRGVVALARRLRRLARWIDARWPVESVTTGWVCVARKP